MQQRRWYCSLLDIAGILSLICSIIALGGAIWFVDVISETLLFKTFYVCLSVAITTFLVSRVAEITAVVIANPDPRTLRARPVSASNAEVSTPVEAVETGNVAQGDFSRAA